MMEPPSYQHPLRTSSYLLRTPLAGSALAVVRVWKWYLVVKATLCWWMTWRWGWICSWFIELEYVTEALQRNGYFPKVELRRNRTKYPELRRNRTISGPISHVCVRVRKAFIQSDIVLCVVSHINTSWCLMMYGIPGITSHHMDHGTVSGCLWDDLPASHVVQ